MVLQQGGVQDIYSFQIGMKPQILNLTKDLGREAAQMAPQMEDLRFHANLEWINILNTPLLKHHFGIFEINWNVLAYPKVSSSTNLIDW